MRVFGVLLLVVLFSAAVMLYLQGKDATESMQATITVADALKEAGVEGSSMDREAARRVITELRMLIDSPSLIGDNMDGLREITAVAASWADAAASPSPELRAAVCIRSAADDLRSYGLSPSDRYLNRARQQLVDAEAALTGESVASSPADAMRDRLKNLERSHIEQYQKVDELGN